jgi:hypothetical protein
MDTEAAIRILSATLVFSAALNAALFIAVVFVRDSQPGSVTMFEASTHHLQRIGRWFRTAVNVTAVSLVAYWLFVGVGSCFGALDRTAREDLQQKRDRQNADVDAVACRMRGGVPVWDWRDEHVVDCKLLPPPPQTSTFPTYHGPVQGGSIRVVIPTDSTSIAEPR